MSNITFIGPWAVVDHADLKKKEHAINSGSPKIKEHDGIMKYEGMLVITKIPGDRFAFAVASGNLPTSKWYVIDDNGTYGGIQTPS